MGYSTFRHFLKEQFPTLRFQKDEASAGGSKTDPESSTTSKPKLGKGQQHAAKPVFMC